MATTKTSGSSSYQNRRQQCITTLWQVPLIWGVATWFIFHKLGQVEKYPVSKFHEVAWLFIRDIAKKNNRSTVFGQVSRWVSCAGVLTSSLYMEMMTYTPQEKRWKSSFRVYLQPFVVEVRFGRVIMRSREGINLSKAETRKELIRFHHTFFTTSNNFIRPNLTSPTMGYK